MDDLDQIIQAQIWIDSALQQWESPTAEQEVAIGLTARRVLDAAWMSDSRNSPLVIAGIRSVCKTFASDPEASAKLLRRAFEPNHLKQFGYEELQSMVQAIPDLTAQDPAFVANLYIAAFGWREPAEDPTYITKSRIFGFRSDKRQDYQLARWQLGQGYPKYLAQEPAHATDVMLSAIETYCREEHRAESVTQQFQVAGIDAEIRIDYSSIWDSWGGHSNDEPVSMLQTYFRYLDERASDPSSQSLVTVLLDKLIQRARDAVIWSHLLELAMKHPWIAHKLRGLSWSQPVLSGFDMRRPMHQFLHVIYPTLTKEEKISVEDAIMGIPQQPGSTGVAGRATRDQFLGALAEHRLQTPRAKRRQKRLREQNALQREAPEKFQIQGGAMAPDPERFYGYRGIDTKQPANQELILLQEPIRDFCTIHMRETPTLDQSATLLPDMEALWCALGDSGPSIPDENILHESFALLIEAASKIAGAAGLGTKGELNRFVETVLLTGASALRPEATPEHNKQFDNSGGWGSPTGRVEAAQGLMALVAKQKCMSPQVSRTLAKLMHDPSAIVRSQIAYATLGLYEHSPETMWVMLSTLRDDPSTRVRLAVTVQFEELARAHPDRALYSVAHILERIDPKQEGASELTRFCVTSLTRYYIWRADATGESAVVRLATELPQSVEAGMMLFPLRHGMMATASADFSAEQALSIRERSVRIFNLLVTNATALLRPLIAAMARKENLSEEDSKLLGELVDLVRIIGRELYFALGAFQQNRFPLPPEITSSEQRWLYHAVGPSWDLLAEIGDTQLAHNLTQSLEMFISLDPEKIFLRIGTVIRAAKAWGYQYEQLAIELIIRIFTTYLADYRSLLQRNAECLRIMRETLELFINTGWSSARRLSYRVDEIFR